MAGSVISRVRIRVPKGTRASCRSRLQESAVAREDHGQKRRGVEVGTGENPQLTQNVGAHLLRFVDQEHRADS